MFGWLSAALEQRALDLLAREVGRVEHAPFGVAALAAQVVARRTFAGVEAHAHSSEPLDCVGPRSTTKRTTSSRQSPAPASSVSATWLSKESSGATTAAMPPGAQLVAESAVPFFVTTVTLPCSAASSAKLRAGDTAAQDQEIAAGSHGV